MPLSRSLILIGMPTSGKSTLGRMVATRLNMPFIDTDDSLVTRVGMPLEAFMKNHGMQAFQKEEEAAILGLVCPKPSIIATGGSVVYSEAAMRHLKTWGSVLYLHLSPDQLDQRLKISPSRALLIPPGQTWEELVDERLKLYAIYADTIFSAWHDTPEQGCEALMRHLASSY